MKNTHLLPWFIKPDRYKILLKPDLKKFTFWGQESIFLTLEKSVKQITLHAVEIEITAAEFVSAQNSAIGKISYNDKAETAMITFPKNLPKGKGELKLTFSGFLNDKMRGFYRSKYEYDGQVKHLAVTQFESTDARRAFPCFDEPSKKAYFDVTLMIPPETRAISNTIEAQILEHESGLKIVEFETTPLMSTYLLAFLVGEFEYLQGRTKKGILVRVFTTPGKKKQAKFALETGIKCLEFYNDYFGINYPLPVLDMVAIPDFAAGAMENWGAVTFRESTLLIDREKSSAANKQWVALVIAHELAHMWFGNLVTMEWWTHLWLNEGFASFIEYLAIDHIFPDWDVWTQFVATETGVAYQLDSLENTHPIEVAVGNPAEISEIFDRVSYSKGAAVLRMLHSYLGPKDFQKGLQYYLKKYSYANAKTEDLWDCLEKISGKPVAKVMKNWTSKSGHPLVSISESGKKLKLNQSRFFSSAVSRKKNRDKTIWYIPDDGKILLNKKSAVISRSLEKPYLKLNMGEASFFRTDYPQSLLKTLTEAIAAKQLAAPDRLGLVRDTFSLAQSGQTPTSLALELALSYRDEEDFSVWVELTVHLSQLDNLLFGELFYPKFAEFGRQIYQNIAQKVGWLTRVKEPHTRGLLRSLVLQKLGSFGDEATIKMAQSLFTQKVDPQILAVIYNLVAENGAEGEFNQLLKKYRQEDNQQEKERIGRSLGRFKDKVLLEKTLKFAISKDVRFQNSLGIIASVWGNPYGRNLAWEFVKSNWELLKQRYAGGHYFTRLFSPASDFTTKKDAKDIERFVKKNPTPEAQRTIAQALEQIYANEAWLKKDKSNIKNFLNKL